MAGEPKLLVEEGQGPRRPVALAILSLVVGAGVGLVGAIFRLGLQRAEVLRTSFIERAHTWGFGGFVLLLGATGLAAGIAAWMVRRFAPESSGSGIPQVEKQLKEGWSGIATHIVGVKFVGGLLAIGSGMALGREGPTVQIGAGLGQLIGKAFQRNDNERRVLLAAGAGAGLATAFNAPIAGAIFVLEELVGGFDVPVTIATLGASAGAIAVARVFLGQRPDFQVASPGYPGFATVPAHLALGIVLGIFGVAYNRAILGALTLTARLRRIRVEWRAAAIGAIVGLLGWFAPNLIGGGDNLTEQVLGGKVLLGTLGGMFLIRFLIGPLSYAARTPGGLFAPMLVIGSQGGFLFGTLWSGLFANNSPPPQEFAIVGMAAFFATVVRAPITGIILVVELTGSFTLLLPMLGAAFAAVMVATILRDPPIYDSLRDAR